MAIFRFLKLYFVIKVMLCAELFCVTAALKMNYYGDRCPSAERMVTNIVNRALQKDPTLSAPLLRMHFHDCFVRGCDGSVLIDSTKGNSAEKASIANVILRGFEVIDQAKEAVESRCRGVVSCADIVAMAARDAVYWAGGPFYDIPKGRKDGRISKSDDAKSLPFPTFNTSQLIEAFDRRGFTFQEMIALSGAHTLGVATCANFKNRLSSSDPTMDSTMADSLTRTCKGKDDAVSPFDPTSTSFDNRYFKTLQNSRGLLTSDQSLFEDPHTRDTVNVYAASQDVFFYDFSQAMIKMGKLKGEGDDGEVRLNCRVIN